TLTQIAAGFGISVGTAHACVTAAVGHMIHLAMIDLMARRLTGENHLLARPDTSTPKPHLGMKQQDATTS
ncbi:hypothetical protein ABT011_36010, partial [Streptomyces virginiae]